MNVEIFAEWLRRQGFHIVHTTSGSWYGHQKTRIYNALASHLLIEPPAEELRELLIRERAVALRYAAPFDGLSGKASYHLVLESTCYDLMSLSSKARYNIRRGLKHCEIEPVSLERLAQEGWILQRDTLERRGSRAGKMMHAQWRRICLTAIDLPGFEAWGAFVEGELAASIMTARIGDTCHVVYQNSHRKYFRKHVNNALCYAIGRELLLRPGIRMVFFGAHHLDAPTSLDRFKLSLGFQAKPIRDRVIFHPWLAPFLGTLSYAVIRHLFRLRPNNAHLSKIEGLLRFYIDGKRPPSMQEWPECLSDRKTELLETLRCHEPRGREHSKHC